MRQSALLPVRRAAWESNGGCRVMAALTKRRKNAREKIDSNMVYAIDEALGLVKELATSKFSGERRRVGQPRGRPAEVRTRSCVVPRCCRTVPARRSGSRFSPRARTRTRRRQRGRTLSAFEDLAEQVKGGQMDFEVVIATPDAMRVVGTLGQIPGSAWPDAEPEGRGR